jgi:CelD/BcsL family acetyltransferase involved in cellulose biosynthesis
VISAIGARLKSANTNPDFRTMPSPLYTIEPITTEDGVFRLQHDWDRLSRAVQFPNVFTTYDWYQTWYRRFARREGSVKRRPHVLALKRNGAVTGISPLVLRISSHFGLVSRRLQFVSRYREWDYNDLVLGDDVAAQTEAVVEYLSRSVKEWDLVDLLDLRDIGDTNARIESALKRVGLSYRWLREEERCPYMPIDGPWSEILSRRSSSTRHTFQNQQSRLKRMGGDGLRMRILDDPRKEPNLLERMIALEAQKRVHGKVSPPFLGLHSGVFASLFDTLGLKGWLCVAVMELNDRLLAWHLLFRCGGKLWGYLTAYDNEYARFSPGRMLIPAIVDYGFTHGYTEYDFLKGEESYKMRWITGFHHNYRLLIWNRRSMSRLCAFAHFKLRVRSAVSTQVEHPKEQPDTSVTE